MGCAGQKALDDSKGDSNISIVIVDDNPGSLEYLSTALATTGLKILTAPNGEEGLALIYRHRPRIVLSDLVMPFVSGLDVLRMVNEFDPKISVVIMSSDDPTALIAKAIEKGRADYLKKPITLSVLRSCIGRLIQTHLSETPAP